MFCTNCGARIEDGNQYCTACGEPCRSGGVGGPPTNTAESQTLSKTPDFQPRRSNTRFIAAVAVAVVALFLGGVALGLNLGMLGGESSSSPTPSALSANSASSASSASSAAATQSASSSSSTGSNAGVAAEERSSAVAKEDGKDSRQSSEVSSEGSDRAMPISTSKPYDLSDPTKYKQMNLFLSNFSEAFWSTEGRSVSSISDEEMAMFAVKHVGVNSRQQCEHAPNGEWGIPPDANAGGPNGFRNIRIKADRIAELCRRYFARDINFDALAVNRHPGWVVYQDGYVYYGVTNGTGYANGVSLAKSAEVLADGSIQVKFDVYGMFYDSSDESLYSCSPSELMRRLDVDGPHQTGVAVVRQGEYNEYTNGLVLVSSNMQRIDR